MKALLIVDLQNDFLPGGALPAPKGEKIIPVINNIIDKFPFVYASQDWHPEESKHFTKWPPHCIKDTRGAQLHKDLRKDKIDRILYKGTGIEDDGYSAFEATNIKLEEDLKKKNIDELYITGLTTEYCVLNSAIDALRKGFKTYVVKDAIEGVRQHEGDVEKAEEMLKNAGIKFVKSSDLRSQ